MSTITKEFTKEQLQQIEAAAKEVMWPVVWSEKKAREHFSEKITPKVVLKLARIALASLEAEPVCVIDQSNLDYLKSGSDADVWPASRAEMGDVLLYRAAPPAPVFVPDELTREEYKRLFMQEDKFNDTFRGGWNACRAAMLQGADTELQRKAEIHDALCEKYNVESLTDFVDWQRNHIAELEAAPPAPVGPGETAVMPDYPGYTMTQRECFQAGKKAGLAEAGNSPVIPDGYALVPVDMTPGMMRAVQINSELGAYAAANLSGAYSLFREFWDVAIAATLQQEVRP